MLCACNTFSMKHFFVNRLDNKRLLVFSQIGLCYVSTHWLSTAYDWQNIERSELCRTCSQVKKKKCVVRLLHPVFWLSAVDHVTFWLSAVDHVTFWLLFACVTIAITILFLSHWTQTVEIAAIRSSNHFAHVCEKVSIKPFAPEIYFAITPISTAVYG